MKKLTLMFVAASAVVLAQGVPGRGPGFGGPGGREMMHLMGMVNSIPNKVVTGAPYSAKEATVETQTLANGTHINRTESAQIYRDGQGRVRTERTFSGVGPWAAGSPKTIIDIFDPVAGVTYILDPATSTAEKLTMPAKRAGLGHTEMAHGANPEAVTTDLGTQTINGLVSTGTRTTITIPVGQIGNDQPLVMINEKWTSTDLQIVVQSTRNDPRMGTVNFSLQNVSRSEPDASLFVPPASYTITDKPSGRAGAAAFRQHGPQR